MFFNLLLFGYTHIQFNSQLQLEHIVCHDTDCKNQRNCFWST